MFLAAGRRRCRRLYYLLHYLPSYLAEQPQPRPARFCGAAPSQTPTPARSVVWSEINAASLGKATTCATSPAGEEGENVTRLFLLLLLHFFHLHFLFQAAYITGILSGRNVLRFLLMGKTERYLGSSTSPPPSNLFFRLPTLSGWAVSYVPGDGEGRDVTEPLLSLVLPLVPLPSPPPPPGSLFFRPSERRRVVSSVATAPPDLSKQPSY